MNGSYGSYEQGKKYHAKHACKVALFQMPIVTSPEEFPLFLLSSVKMCDLVFPKCELMMFRAIVCSFWQVCLCFMSSECLPNVQLYSSVAAKNVGEH